MTDNELEQQAKLWHVASRLNPEKTERLSETLQEALPQVRLRRYGITTLATALLVSATIGVFRVEGQESSLVRETKIEKIDLIVRTGTIWTRFLRQEGVEPCLASDGTVARIAYRYDNVAKTGNYLPALLRPGSTYLEFVPVPKGISFGAIPEATLTGFLPDGAVFGSRQLEKRDFTVSNRVFSLPVTPGPGVLWQNGKCVPVPPLAGYTGVKRLMATKNGLVGESVKTAVITKLVEDDSTTVGVEGGSTTVLEPRSQLTLWREGKPEPLPIGNDRQYYLVHANRQGDILLGSTESNKFVVLSQGKPTPLRFPEERPNPDTWIVPRRIGKGRKVVGILSADGVVRGALWQSPSEKPKPLWEDPNPIAPIPIECNDIDDKGRVVGAMKSPLREQNSAFLWRDGRYIDLQTLLPRSSRWRLLSANQIAGRTILGHGEFNGQPSEYRLTLPRQLE